jgi:hypothetical protein
MNDRFDIRRSLIGYQQRILGNHQAVRGMTAHPTVMGDQSEQDWAAILRNFLPERYEVGPIIAVDSNGAQSEQIDVGIFDRQYSPLWFGRQGATRIVPVESVYAAFEVKPEMNKQYIEYAASKVASVRRLHRTSAATCSCSRTTDSWRLESVLYARDTVYISTRYPPRMCTQLPPRVPTRVTARVRGSAGLDGSRSAECRSGTRQPRSWCRRRRGPT